MDLLTVKNIRSKTHMFRYARGKATISWTGDKNVRLVVRNAHSQAKTVCESLHGGCCGLQAMEASAFAALISFAREMVQTHTNTEITVREEPKLLVTPWCNAEEAAEEAAQLLCGLSCDASHCCTGEMLSASQGNASSAQPESVEAAREICDLRHFACVLIASPAAAEVEGNTSAFQLQYRNSHRCQWSRPAITNGAGQSPRCTHESGRRPWTGASSGGETFT